MKALLLIAGLFVASIADAQCNSAVVMTYGQNGSSTTAAVNGSVYEVVVDLGFFSGEFPATLYRFSAELACPSNQAWFGCQEAAGVFEYLGDRYLTTDCPTHWTTGHFRGAYPGDIVFEANPPLVFTTGIVPGDWGPDVPPVAGRHCQVRYLERLIGGVPDTTYRQVLGLRYHGEDALCADGLPAGNIDTNSIRMAP